MHSYVIDTYAWIEYFNGTQQGSNAKEYIEGGHDISVPSLVLAELADSFHQGRVGMEWEAILRFILVKCSVIELSPEIAFEAARIEKAKRPKHHDFSLADGIILATARKTGSILVTGDEHLTDENGVVNIRV
ncbi:MAG: PIN domain-containing protein [Candidatus Aenigmarchaeota archaeon]|nr:PIN domain-containing protein [Candidatus Aenigmarchaeota archaeon]